MLKNAARVENMKRSVVMMIGMLAAMLVFRQMAEEVCSGPVSTNQGKISGVSAPQQPVCVYKGVPYAAPPVGALRFRPPEPAPTWEGVKKADTFSKECIQERAKAEQMSEDCLYLNIWRPQKSGKFPVMVWIHGGGFWVGSGTDPLYWGDRLAAPKEVVVVTINYRLGALGFLAQKDLSQEDPKAASGNYGFLDQIAALQWVKENISGFGGDPNNVLIFGESAGGASVCDLLASPLAAGLFQKAIIESGLCDMTKSLEDGFKDGDGFVERAGCKAKEVPACLRALPPEQVLLAMKEKKEPGEKSGAIIEKGSENFVFVPHLDGWVLKETPIEALKSGRYNRVPLMIGTNRDEAKWFMAPGVRLASQSTIRKMLTDALGAENTERVEKLYPYGQYRRPADAALDAAGDRMLGCRGWWAAEAVSGQIPVYYYRFDYDQHFAPHRIGAAHEVEIPFVFGSLDRSLNTIFMTRALPIIFPTKALQKKARPLSDAMMSYWTNFARTGDPNGAGLTPWPKYDTASRQRIYLDLPVSVKTTDNVEKCAFWGKID